MPKRLGIALATDQPAAAAGSGWCMMESSSKKLSFKARNPEETKERILQAAVDEFAGYGFLGARVERIARRSDVTMRMLYHYFKSKEYIYGVALGHVFADIGEREKALDVSGLAPVEKLSRIVDFTFDLLVGNPTFVRLAVGRTFLESGHLDRLPKTAPAFDRLRALTGEALAEGMAAGAMRAGLDGDGLWTMIHALCWADAMRRSVGGGEAAGPEGDASQETRRRRVRESVLAIVSA